MPDNPIVAYFGYGSLVNRRTLSPGVLGAWRARLAGWRRHWQPRDHGGPGMREAALLSVHRDEACEIDGLLILDRAENLAAVDAREARYDRIRLDARLLAPAQGDAFPPSMPESFHLYVGRKTARTAAEANLLQSYLDVVLAGFRREFGHAGIERFLASTEGFGRAIIEDRGRPLYPRALAIDPETANAFDAALAGAGVRFRAGNAGGFSP